MLSKERRLTIGAVCVLAAIAIAIGYFHVYSTIDVPGAQPRFELHQQILTHTAGSPYRYRVLAPYLAEALRVIASAVNPEVHASFLVGFRWFDTLAVFATLLALFAYFRDFSSGAIALIGSAVSGALMVIPLRDHYYQPWSLLEPAFIALGLLALRKRRLKSFLAIMLVATLNRETSLLLVIAAAFEMLWAWWQSDARNEQLKESLIWIFSAALVWGATFAALRLALGAAPSIEPVGQLWIKNTRPDSVLYALQMWALFLGPLWLLAAAGWRYADSFSRRMCILVPVQVALIAVFGVWFEVRLLMPLYAVLMPLCLAFMFGNAQSRVAAQDVAETQAA